MSFFVTAVTAVVSLTGTAIAIKGQQDQAKAAEFTADYNAQAAEQQATHETEIAAENARRKSRENSRIIGLQKEAIAASGLAITGTPLAMLGESVSLLERDIMDMGYEASARVRQLHSAAAMGRWEGSTTAEAYKTAQVGTAISGIGSAAGGYFKASGQI